MKLTEMLAMELEQEGANTRKVLERLPEKDYGYKPHEKSWTALKLASHTAEMLIWGAVTVNEPEFDMKGEYKGFEAGNRQQLLDSFDKGLKDFVAALRAAPDAALSETWTLKDGERVLFSMPRGVVLRSFVFNHMIHHRAQLCVYLRLLDVPVPAIYGPSADEKA